MTYVVRILKVRKLRLKRHIFQSPGVGTEKQVVPGKDITIKEHVMEGIADHEIEVEVIVHLEGDHPEKALEIGEKDQIGPEDPR